MVAATLARSVWNLSPSFVRRVRHEKPVPTQPLPRAAGPHVTARYPNHVWSVDRTRVWRWHLWPTWASVAVDHYSRMVTAVCRPACSRAALARRKYFAE